MAKRKRRAKHRSGDCSLGWRGDWAVACFPNEVTGKRARVRLGVYEKDEDAIKALNQFAEQRRVLRAAQQSHTIESLWKKWLDERAQDGFRNDIYEAQWVSLKSAFAHRLPHTLKTQDFRDYARARFHLGRSAWTVHNELVRLRTCLKWSHETHLIDRPTKVWVPSPGGHRDRVLTFDEARLLVAAASEGDPHIYLFVVLAFATGARHTAILDLTWDRVDFLEATISFDENLPKDPMSRSWRKGRATVPMNRVARAALERAYEGRRTKYAIEHGGRRLKTIRSGFANAVERAGLGQRVPHPKKAGETMFVTDITPHTIRHTVLTWLDEANVETRRAAQLAGHKDERTTKMVYTHAAPEVLKDAVELLDGAFAPLPRIGLEAAPEHRSGDRKTGRLSRRDNNDSGKSLDAGE